MSDRSSRRQLLLDAAGGFGWLALACMLPSDILGAGDSSPVASNAPHFEPRAKRVIQIFAVGGMSHLDTFDFKPELQKRDGKPYAMPTFFGQGGSLRASPWEFRRHGESGQWVSGLLPNLAGQVDKLAVIRSMVAKSANHMPAVAQMNTGFILTGFPAMGAWVTYGLGTENRDLPAFVVLPDPNSHPWGGSAQWTNGFLPATVQGTAFRTRGDGDPVPDLTTPKSVSPTARDDAAAWLRQMNRSYAEAHPGDSSLQARIRSYEVAAKMQLSVPEIADLNQESEATRQLYGHGEEATRDLAANCLLARRLIERGVRFVQIYHGGSGKNWDAHSSLVKNHEEMAREYDRPVSGLLSDLESRGLLRDTLVLGMTEFGRTPVSQGTGSGAGRDHHPNCFTCWMAGGGLPGGQAYGASDDLGYEPAANPLTIYDLHATALHLLGLDHERLTFYHNGINRRLTDVHGHVVEGLIG